MKTVKSLEGDALLSFLLADRPGTASITDHKGVLREVDSMTGLKIRYSW
jgi:hypothetical protein